MSEDTQKHSIVNFPEPTEEDIAKGFWGTEDFNLINKEMVSLVLRLRDINKRLTEYERKKTTADSKYKHEYRKSYLTQSAAKNETHRRILIEIENEKLEFEISFYDEMIRELTREAHAIRFEMDTLKTIAYNIRQELRI